MQGADINQALRTEVLIFSTTGIALALQRANSIPSSRDIPTAEQYPVSLDPRNPLNMHSVVEITVSRDDFSDFSASQRGVVRDKSPPLAGVSSNAAIIPSAFPSENGAVGPSNGESLLSPDVARAPFLDYAPQVFRFLRLQFKIDENSYRRSIQGRTEAMVEKFTEGRGGAFFYFSEDSQYIVKTLTTSEGKFLTRFLPAYVAYMSANPESLLSRFVGFHAITLYNLTIHFMVMQSVFLTTRKVHERYDLKGSTVDRHASKAPPLKVGKGEKRGAFRSVVFKDSDLNRTVLLARRDREKFLRQITRDAFFLRDQNIMDYSLLLGVHHTSHQVPLLSPRVGEPPAAIPSSASSASLSLTPPSASSSVAPISRPASADLFPGACDGGVQASIIEGPGIYFFGVIDILQEWNTNKKLEQSVPMASKWTRLS
jgi:hypothetical protein